MICALTPEQQLDFLGLIGSLLNEASASDKSFNVQQFVKDIYDELNDDPADDSLALTYAQLVPSNILEVIGLDKEIAIALRKKGFSSDAILDLLEKFEDKETGLDAVKSYVAPVVSETELKDLDDAQKKKDSAIPTKIEEPQDVNQSNVVEAVKISEPEILKSKVSSIDDQFNAAKPTAMATMDNEAISSKKDDPSYNVPKPALVPYFTTLRNVIKKLFGYSNATKVPFGPKEGIYLSAIKTTEIEKRYPGKGYLRPDLIVKENDEGVMLMLTDKNGEPLTFNMNPGEDSYGEYDPNGKPLMFFMRTIYPGMKTEGKVTSLFKKKNESTIDDYDIIESMIRAGAYSGTRKEVQERAQKELLSQLNIINDIRTYIQNNPEETVLLNITGGNMGYVQKDKNILTPMLEMAPGEVTSFKANVIPNAAEGIRAGDITFTTASTGAKQLITERPFLKDNSQYIDRILTLLFDDVSTAEGPLTISERIALISPYIKLGDKNGTINIDLVEDEGGTYRVKFNDKTVYSSANPETKQTAKADVAKAFGEVVRGADVTLVVAEKRKILADAKSPITEKEKAEKYLALIDEKGTPVAGRIRKEGDNYFFYGFPRLNANINLVGNKYKKANLTAKPDGTYVADISLEDYNEDYLVPTSLIPYELTGDKKIRTMNAYLTYELSPEGASKLNPVKEEKKEKAPVKGAKEVRGSRRSTLDKLIGLDKRIQQKNINPKEAAEKMEAAKAWWKSHPLSKHFTLTEMFDVVNAQNKNAIARWTLQGVTLYKGSDYTDLYHEAWHAFSQTFMTQAERDAAYGEARKNKGFFTDYKGHRVSFKTASDKQIEEYLAEEFRSFMLAGGKKDLSSAPAKRNFFQKMWDILKALFEGITVKEVVANEQANKNINELFNKLSVGDLSGRTFTYENAQFGVEGLNQTLTATDSNDEIQNLSLEDSRLLVSILDSVLSENIDIVTAAQQMRQQKSGSTKWATSLLKDPAKLKLLYVAAKEQLEETVEGLNDAYENASDEQKAIILKKLDILDWALRNFGDLDNLMMNRPVEGVPVKGVIGYHLLKSKIVDEDFKDVFFDEENETEESVFNKGREGYDKSGNEVSLKDQASKEIIFLLSGLHKMKNGKPVYIPGTEYEVEIDGKIEKRGIMEIEDFDVVWNTLVKNLAGTLSAEVMYGKLLQLAKNSDLPFAQLVNDKLGSVYNNQSSEEFNIWTNFWQTFNKAHIPLLQTTVEIEVLDRGNAKEKTKFVIKPGRANTNTKQVERAWSNNFAVETTKFIKPDKGGIRQLDLAAVIEAYPTLASVNKDKLGFLQAIGFNLENNPDIIKALEEGAVDMPEVYDLISKARYRLDDKGQIKIIFRDIRDYKIGIAEDKNNYYYPSGSNTPVKSQFPAPKKFLSTKVYDSILELQARYSAKFSNFMVSNAEGNTQFEHSLNNTMSVMVSAVNDSPTYDDLIALPWMKHLDYRRNPRAKHSAWLKAMFPNFGKKAEIAPGVPKVLTLENLSGVAVSVDGIFDDRLGTSSASADATTKIMMDFHNLIIKGVPELMRHSDKSTSYTLFVDKMNFTYSRDTSLYAIPAAFYKVEDDNKKSDGESALMTEALLPNLYAEYENIALVRAKKAEIEKLKKAGKPLPEADYKYLDRASNFVSFQNVITDPIKEKLYDAMSKGIAIEELLKSDPDLKGNIVRDIYAYMDRRVQNFRETLESVGGYDLRKTIAENIYSTFGTQLRKLDKKVVTKDSKIEEALIKAFVYNSWIHNIESTNFLYGDPAQYNMAKEEFHKRNAGASSTGTLYRTDKAAMDYINNAVGRKLTAKYAEKDATYLPASTRAYNGTFNTAVLRDNEIRSAYFEEYAQATIEAEMLKSNAPDEASRRKEAEEKVLGLKKDKTGKILERGTIAKPLKGSLLYAYENMTEGDGQGWVTLDSYRILLKLEGIWSDAQENLYNKIVNGEKIKPSDVVQTFPVQKLQYWGALQTDEFALTAFHKFSLMPLVPTVIKNSNLQKLHEKMMREGIDYATFNSGSKVGTITKAAGSDKIYTDDNRTLDQDTPFTKNVIFLNYLKNQLAIAPKFKEKVVFSTQLRKLIESGLVENGIPVDFMPGQSLSARKEAWEKALENGTAATPLYKKYKAYESLVDLESRIKKRELIDEIGWSIDPKTDVVTGDIQNLVDFIHTQFSNKDLAEHELAFIKIGPDGKLDTDLSLSLSAAKIEKMLNAIVAKRLINQKVTGEGLIQVSGALFENDSAWTDRKNATPEELAKWGTNDLPTYHKGVDGKTTAMKVKIAMQGNFKNLLELSSVAAKAKEENITRIEALNKLIKDEAWLNEGDNRKMITMTGVRIPVQGLNSMEFMEVYEFLPEEAGNILVPPAEIVAKSGSDFDVDKLTVMMPAIGKYGNEISLIKYDPSIKKSKAELKKEIAEKKMLKADTIAEYEELFEQAKEDKIFKTLSSEEQQLVKELEGRIKTLKNQIKPLKKEWAKIQSEQGIRFFTSAAFTALDQELSLLMAEQESLIKDIKANISTFYKGKVYVFNEAKNKAVAAIDEEINKLNKALDSVSTKGVENDLISSIVDILSDPVNYVNFITPNSTDAVQPLSEELAPFVSSYSPKENGESVMAGNRIFEYEYNLYKHQSNKVGKEVLGMGAVDNTFNIIFNRIGAAMKSKVPMYDLKGDIIGYFDQKLHMAHNTVEDDLGTAISLSHIMDAKGENNIADIISQLMNGWVDVAKDSWVFNIQGNKELAPVLLFLVQAGVPFRTAVMFLSQPVIREYAEKVRRTESSFAPLYEKNIKSWDIVKKLGERFSEVEKEMLMEINQDSETKKEVKKLHTDVAIKRAFGKEELTGEDLEDILKNPGNNSPRKQLAILRHFEEILNMSNAVKEVKVNVNPDTKRSTNLYEAMMKQKAFEKAKMNQRLSDNLVGNILGDTVIKSFNVQKFQIELYKDLFKLSNDPRLLNELQDVNYKERASTGVSDAADFGNLYRSDFISFIFQNKLKYFDPSDIKYYHGYGVEKAEDIKKEYFSRGVFFKDGKLYMDPKRIQFDFEKQLYTGKGFYKVSKVEDSYKNLSLATIPYGTFGHYNEYVHFVIEREYLRNFYKDASFVENDMQFVNDKELMKKTSPILEGEDVADYQERLNVLTFEEFLKNKALENIWNTKALFASEKPFSDKLLLIQNKYGKELTEEYPVLGALKVNSATRKGVTYSNVTLIDKIDDDPELIDLYHSNILKLSNPDVQKVSNPEDNAFISEYFRKLAIVAYLQSGQNTKTRMSITRIMPDQDYLALMKDNSVNIENAYEKQSLDEYKKTFFIENNASRGSLKNRFKDYTIWDKNIFEKEKKEVTIRKYKNASEPITIPFTEVPGELLTARTKGVTSSALALVSAEHGIQISRDVTVNGFFEYLTGKTGSTTSEQKKAVLEEIAKAGYTLPVLQKLINKPERVKMFLLLHEQSHIDNNDRLVYYAQGGDLMTSDKIAIETRATLDALENLKVWIAEATEEKRMHSNYAGTLTANYKDLPLENGNAMLDYNTDKVFIFSSPKEAAPYSKKGNVLPFVKGFTADQAANEQVINTFIDTIKQSGKTPVFPAEGLGQELIGNLGGAVAGKPISTETFLYLSRKLYEEFRWLNPNWIEGYRNVLESSFSEYAVVQDVQDVSDDSLEEFIKGCKTKK